MGKSQRVYCDYCGNDIAQSDDIYSMLTYKCVELCYASHDYSSMVGSRHDRTDKKEFCDMDCCSLFFQLKNALKLEER